MDQVTARKLAHVMNAQSRGVHIATTDTHLRGEWDTADSKWLVVRITGEISVIEEVPEGIDIAAVC